MRFSSISGLAVAALALAGCTSPLSDFRLAPQQPTNATLRLDPTPESPSLEPGAPGEFDSVDVLNPSVFRGPDGKRWNLYSGFDGRTWHTGLAVEAGPDGNWNKQGRVLSPDPKSWEGDDYIAANGSALYADGEILYWYQAGRVGGATGPRIGLARSRDGRNWTRSTASPVLDAGPYRSWDERGVADPYVIRQANALYLYYTGLDRAGRQQLGVARSTDGGVHWQKHGANPILALTSAPFEDAGLGEPAVFAAAGRYWMLYTGRAWDEQRRILLAESPDGITWTRVPNWVLAGSKDWDRKVVCDPTVEVAPEGAITVWFGGGDEARPDERVHGRIGAVSLKLKQP